MAPKERPRGGRAKASRAGRGSFAIALCVHDLARVTGARTRTGEPARGDALLARLGLAREDREPTCQAFVLARAAPLIASLAFSGCAPVGPNFERPAAIVSPQFKEIKGWKIATPRANEPKGEWWSVFHDPELDQLMRVVAVSNQTIKADEANYRQALALINEARAGLFPTINGTGSATRSSPGGTNLTAEATGAWTLDVWGQVRREIEAQQAGAETNAAILANALLAAQSALALAYVTLRQADLLEDLLAGTIEDYKRSVTITQNQYNAGTAAKSDVITAQAQLLNAQAALHRRRRVARAKRTCDRGPDGPPSRRPVDPARKPGDPRSPGSGRPAVVTAGAQAGRRGGGGDHAPGQRPDRRRVRRVFSSRVALRPHRLFRQSVRNPVRSEQSCLVVRRFARSAFVQRRPHHRAGRSGAPDLSRGRRYLSPDRA